MAAAGSANVVASTISAPAIARLKNPPGPGASRPILKQDEPEPGASQRAPFGVGRLPGLSAAAVRTPNRRADGRLEHIATLAFVDGAVVGQAAGARVAMAGAGGLLALPLLGCDGTAGMVTGCALAATKACFRLLGSS